MKTVLATLVGAVLSLIPWVAGLLTPDLTSVECDAGAGACLFAYLHLGLLDVVLKALVPVAIVIVLVPLLSGVLLRVLGVRPARAISAVAIPLVLLAWLIFKPAVPSVAATIMWAVSYLVAELTVNSIRARRARSGQESPVPRSDPPSQDL